MCLSADGPLSIEMEKVLSKQPGSEGVKSDKVLELNVNHPRVCRAQGRTGGR